jgi:folate-binding protein YgfZ
MSTQITRKSKGETPPAEGALVGAPAPTLAGARRPAYAPSHGRAAEPLPAAPVGLLDLGPAAALAVRGPDRESWLQGMQTADVGAAPLGGAVYAAFLSGKGRLVADGFVWRFADELVVTTPADRLAALHQHLDKLLIMEDAELGLREGLHRLRFYPGEQPCDAPGAAETTGSWLGLGLELLVSEARAQELIGALPAVTDLAHVEQHRVALGVPLFGRDLDEETVPLEGGLDRAISFSKGCYVGQEVVAMATYRGRVLWNLVRMQVAGARRVDE